MTDLVRRLFGRRNRPAWAAFAVCILLTWATWVELRQQARNTAELQFNSHVSNMDVAIWGRLRRHEQILLGGAGLFDASASVSRENWHAYVARLLLDENFPGIQGVGFSEVIQPAALPAHIAKIRSEGFPEYTVRPAGERPLYSSIIFLEPFTDRNLAAFGFDMLSEPIRTKAMYLAAESGKPAISGKVKLVQETHGKTQAGFLMYVPIYRKHAALTTPTERRNALKGFVYSPYRVNDLMRGILGDSLGALNFTIYDGTAETEEAQLYASTDDRPAEAGLARPRLSALRTIDAYGHTWTVRFQSRPGFESGFASSFNIVVPILGGSISVLLLVFLLLLISRRDRAEKMARQMTVDIRSSEQNLRRSQLLLNSIVEHIPAMVFVKRASDLRFELFNRTGEKLLGYSREDLLGKNDHDFFTKEQADAFTAMDRKVLDSEEAMDIPEEAVKTARGETRYLHTMKIGLRDETGVATHLLGISLDITERKMQENIEQERTLQTQAILDNVIDGIITIDSLGTVQSMNRASESIFGYAAGEVIGKNINMLMPEPYHSQHDGYLKNYRDSGVPHIIGSGREVEGLRRDGRTFPIDLAVSRSVHQGQPLFIGLVRDITERRRVEQMKSDFVSTVSHELRTPLTSISGALGLINGGALGEMPAEIKPMLAIAHKNSLRLSHLINDLLDMEKLAAGKMRFDFQVQPLMPLVEQALETTRGYAEQYQVSYVLTERANDVRVRVDGSRLQQVLANFLSNAAKFSPRGGQVEIAVRQDKVTVRVEVSDHGTGIPEAFRNQIFHKFSQADSSDTRQKGGTGLGLAISKELIERMNGLVGFASEEGQGAKFHFELPVWQAHVPNTTETAAREIPGAQRLLVVEDKPDIARPLSLMLSRAGYIVDVAHDGETALNYLEQGRYAAMTLDLMLQDHSGIMLIRKIRSRAETEALPIIVVSAFTEDGKLSVSDNFAAIDWLDKPIDEKCLTAAIRRNLPASWPGRPRVLHVEDDADQHRIVATICRDVADFTVARSLAEARIRLTEQAYDLVILDIGLPDGSGWELLPQLQALDPEPPVIVLSGAEQTPAQQAAVQSALIKSHTPHKDLLDTLKRLIVTQPSRAGEKTP